MSENNAPDLSIATALFFTWSIFTFCVRAWVKLRRSEGWGWDDSTITAALVFSLIHVISIFWAVHAGYGAVYTELADPERNESLKAFFASQLFYIISIGLSKISTGLFIGHLTRHGPQVIRAYVLSGLCGVWTIASLFIVGLRGDLREPWNTVNGSHVMFVRWTIVEVTGLAVELALWGLSIIIIWNLSMALGKRCTILAIFGCRLLLIPLVSLRLFWLSASKNPQLDSPNMTADILTEAVLQVAFISASVTCLKPFLKPFASSTYVVSSVGNSGTGWRSGASANSKDPYYALSAIQTEEGGAVKPTADEKPNGPKSKNRRSVRTSFRPDNFDQEATVSASSSEDAAPDQNNPDQMIIRKTESWSVRFEEGGPTPAQDDPKAGSVQTTIHE